MAFDTPQDALPTGGTILARQEAALPALQILRVSSESDWGNRGRGRGGCVNWGRGQRIVATCEVTVVPSRKKLVAPSVSVR